MMVKVKSGMQNTTKEVFGRSTSWIGFMRFTLYRLTQKKSSQLSGDVMIVMMNQITCAWHLNAF